MNIVTYSQPNKWLDEMALPSSYYVYVLLDPLKSESTAHPLYLSELKNRFKNHFELVLRPDIAHSPQYCPHLFVLAYPNEPVDFQILSETLKYAQEERFYSKRYVCGWITSELEPKKLASYIVENMQRFIQINGNNVLPYYEPFRLELLLNTLTEEEMALLFPKILKWSFVSFNNRVKTLQNFIVPIQPNNKIRFNYKSEQIQDQRQALLQLCEMWQEVIAEPLPLDALSQIIPAWLSILRYRLFHQSDYFFLVLNQLTITDKFCELPEIAILIEQATKNRTFNLIKAIQHLSPTV